MRLADVSCSVRRLSLLALNICAVWGVFAGVLGSGRSPFGAGVFGGGMTGGGAGFGKARRGRRRGLRRAASRIT